jgi:hypothetical protein
MRRRSGLSTVLILGALVLLLAIVVGTNMGNRVLGQIGVHVPVEPTPVPPATAVPGESNAGDITSWKHVSVMSVATDPGFPDPRVTPEPEPPSTPRPKPTPTKTPPPLPTPPPRYVPPTAPAADSSGSPAAGTATPGPDIEATPNGAARAPAGRATPIPYPTMPPVPTPSYGQ